jgi:hypothetical protein
LITGIKTLIAIRTQREKTAGDCIIPQVINLDENHNAPLLMVSLSPQICGLSKEKVTKKKRVIIVVSFIKIQI